MMIEVLITLILVIAGIFFVMKLLRLWDEYEKNKIDANALAVVELFSIDKLIELHKQVVVVYEKAQTEKNLNAIKIYKRAIEIKQKFEGETK